jgi:lipopolysaccharide export system protein LptA
MINILRKKHYTLFLIAALFTEISALAQQVRTIEVLNANTLEFDKSIGADARRLIGNVIFRHGDATMYCDSAWFFPAQNIMDAYGRIKIVQGDSLHLYGDLLHYMGDTKFAIIQKNVVLIDKGTTLKTEYLDYDLNTRVAHYIDKGVIVNGKNTLTSKTGQYFAKEKLFYFRDQVKIVNPDYVINSDTLKYHTDTKVANFMGPTDIIGKEDYIYCENGWYNTQKDISQFNKNAYLENGKQLLKGDSLYYDRKDGIGRAFNNVYMIDSAQDAILKGDYGLYYEKPQRVMMTKRAELININGGDSIFIHADTLRSDLDSSQTYKIIRAYHQVKLFKLDLQGKCDSLSYSAKDSVIRLFGEPTMWSDENQLTANNMEIHTLNKKIDFLQMEGLSLIISREDSSRFNQIKGKKMKGFFRDNQLYKIDVNGNGQTIYFAEDNNALIGVNRAESSNLVIYLKDKKVDKIYFYTNPTATLFPINSLSDQELKLEGFKWLEEYRPLQKEDIFIWKKDKAN